MVPEDLDFAAACSKTEGWRSETRPMFEDFLVYDSAGCFIAETDGRRAGMCIATAYQRHGFIGELIILPTQRGRGVGTILFNHAFCPARAIG